VCIESRLQGLQGLQGGAWLHCARIYDVILLRSAGLVLRGCRRVICL